MKDKIRLKLISGALLCTMTFYTMPVFAFTKEETVYSKLDIKGNKYKTIVENHIKNETAEETLHDISDLINIENVIGEEEYKKEGNNLIWDAKGNDIYYQGESQKELPIECNVKYELDGKEIEAKNLAGKSGKVKVTLEYTNKEAHVVNIDGKNETLYTPFVVVCGTVIDNESNKNIDISNGKVINDGTKTIVIGIALPGMQESLGISKEKLEVPSTVEITMESTDFELNNIVTYVTPKIIKETDLEIFNKLDTIYQKVNTLKSASKELEEGAYTLQEGVTTYTGKSGEFNEAIKQVSEGMTNANNSYSQIDTAIGLLNKNSTTLQSGAKTIKDGTEAVSTNLETISEKLKELETGNKKLQEGEKELEAGLDQIIVQISKIKTTDNSSKIKELEKLVETNTNTIKMLSTKKEENKDLIILLTKNNEATKATIETLKQTDESSINKLIAGLNSLKQGIKNVEDGTQKLYVGTTALKEGSSTLASKTKELSQGAKTLYQGTTKISEGTKTLNEGSNKMKKGLNTLDSSTGLLVEANGQLVEGANVISDGITTLADGISKFNKEGIQTICNYINGDLKNLSNRLQKLEELSKDYTHFTMLSEGENGSTRFIMIMDSIKKDGNNNENIVFENKNDIIEENEKEEE